MPFLESSLSVVLSQALLLWLKWEIKIQSLNYHLWAKYAGADRGWWTIYSSETQTFPASFLRGNGILVNLKCKLLKTVSRMDFSLERQFSVGCWRHPALLCKCKCFNCVFCVFSWNTEALWCKQGHNQANVTLQYITSQSLQSIFLESVV